MNERNEQLAQSVVEVFKNAISPEARAHLTEAEFAELRQIVLEALALEMAEAAEMVAELEKNFKQRAGRQALEL